MEIEIFVNIIKSELNMKMETFQINKILINI
jgi:hypothetical protein